MLILKWWSHYLGYKVRQKGTNGSGLDIFLLGLRNKNGKDIMAYARDGAHDTWPNTWFPPEALNNLTTIVYGHLKVSSVPLNEAIPYLTRYYGGDWYTSTVKSANHLK